MIEIFKTVKKKLVSKYLKDSNTKKKFKPRIKARIRKNKQIFTKNLDNFFDWIKGAELVELKECNRDEDPVRPELDKLSQDAYLQSTLRGQIVGKIAIAYTVWSKKKGGGKLIVKEVFKKIKKSNHLNRLVTLSPLTDMAYKFHSKNGAKLIQVNETTQNFEYKVPK